MPERGNIRPSVRLSVVHPSLRTIVSGQQLEVSIFNKLGMYIDIVGPDLAKGC